jgi:hypothetical protein
LFGKTSLRRKLSRMHSFFERFTALFRLQKKISFAYSLLRDVF